MRGRDIFTIFVKIGYVIQAFLELIMKKSVWLVLNYCITKNKENGILTFVLSQIFQLLV